MTLSALGEDDFNVQKDCLKSYRPLFLDELQPIITSDYLFQYGIFDLELHDRIEQLNSRRDQTRFILHYLERMSPDCFDIFKGVLKISNQEFILHIIKEEECRSKP